MSPLLFGGLLACGPQTDSERYTWALTQASSYEKARRACGGIDDTQTRGDCLTAIMESFEMLDDQECRALEHGEPELALWRDECMFQLAERLRARGNVDAALQTCLETRFGRECAWHLVQDEAEASLDEPPTIAELRLARFADAQRIPDAPLQFWTIRFRAQAATRVKPDEQSCAELSDPEPCREALRRHIRMVLDARLQTAPVEACRLPDDSAATVPSTGWAKGPVARAAVLDWQLRNCASREDGKAASHGSRP